jgi:hexosaminidase
MIKQNYRFPIIEILAAILTQSVAIFAADSAAISPHPALIPLPAKVEWRDGVLAADGAIRRDHVASLPAEGYEIEIAATGAVVRSSSDAGAFYAEQTLKQLRAADGSWPCVSIHDEPCFVWRGFMLDVSRHFFDKPTILRLLDRMAALKLNRFHLHLTDDQGWRLAIEKYPELTQTGARGNYSDPDAPPRFFTKSEMLEIISYAAQRHIVVVPEIDMPGHSHAATHTFPNLNGGANTLNPASPATYEFTQNVLLDVMDIFPSPWIHVGGDEVNAGAWKNNSIVVNQMQAEGIMDPQQLKSYFMRRISKVVEEHGRTPAVWHEALATKPDTNTVIFLWRAYPATLKKALETGHSVVLTPSVPFYLSARAKDSSGNPTVRNTLEDVYRGTPLLTNVPPAQLKQILGLQACVWTEHIATVPELEAIIMPRLAAMAEAAWTPADRKDFADFNGRLHAHLE